MSFDLLDDALTEAEGVEKLNYLLTQQKRKLIFWAVFFLIFIILQIGCFAYHFYLVDIEEEGKNWPQTLAYSLFLASTPLALLVYFKLFFVQKTNLEIQFLSAKEANQRFFNRIFLALSIFVMALAMLIGEADNSSLTFLITFLCLFALAINLFFYTIIEKCLKHHFLDLLTQQGQKISTYQRSPLLINVIGLLFCWFIISLGASDVLDPTKIAPFVMHKTVTIGATMLAIGIYFVLELAALLLLNQQNKKITLFDKKNS